MSKHIKKKHHYLPRFHLNKWINENGLLLVYRKDAVGTVDPKRKHPSQICFETDLYTVVPNFLDAVSPSDYVENELSKIDSEGAKVLHKILHSSSVEVLSIEDKEHWATYVNSLLVRHPTLLKRLDSLANSYITELLDDVEESNSEIESVNMFRDGAYGKNQVRFMLLNASRDREFVKTLSSFRWLLVDVSQLTYKLLLTDSPVVTVGEQNDIGLLALALSPELLWIAFPSHFEEEGINEMVKYIVMLYNAAQIARFPEFIISRDELAPDGLHNYKKILGDFMKAGPRPNTHWP